VRLLMREVPGPAHGLRGRLAGLCGPA
jgi:hypothetical protein